MNRNVLKKISLFKLFSLSFCEFDLFLFSQFLIKSYTKRLYIETQLQAIRNAISFNPVFFPLTLQYEGFKNQPRFTNVMNFSTHRNWRKGEEGGSADITDFFETIRDFLLIRLVYILASSASGAKEFNSNRLLPLSVTIATNCLNITSFGGNWYESTIYNFISRILIF